MQENLLLVFYSSGLWHFKLPLERFSWRQGVNTQTWGREGGTEGRRVFLCFYWCSDYSSNKRQSWISRLAYKQRLESVYPLHRNKHRILIDTSHLCCAKKLFKIYDWPFNSPCLHLHAMKSSDIQDSQKVPPPPPNEVLEHEHFRLCLYQRCSELSHDSPSDYHLLRTASLATCF